MKLSDYKVGNKVRFSHEGLYTFIGHFGPDDPRLSWRFEVVGFTKSSLLLKRLDDSNDQTNEPWSPNFFEVVKS